MVDDKEHKFGPWEIFLFLLVSLVPICILVAGSYGIRVTTLGNTKAIGYRKATVAINRAVQVFSALVLTMCGIVFIMIVIAKGQNRARIERGVVKLDEKVATMKTPPKPKEDSNIDDDFLYEDGDYDGYDDYNYGHNYGM